MAMSATQGNQSLRSTTTGLLEAENKFDASRLRNSVAERALESLAYSAEGDPDPGSRLKLFAGRLTVPNIESRCDQLDSTSSEKALCVQPLLRGSKHRLARPCG